MKKLLKISLVLSLSLTACSGTASTEAQIATGLAKTQEEEYLSELIMTATQLAIPTETPTPTPRPTKTPTPDLPDYCYEDANDYLDQVDEIINGIIDAQHYWNNSARLDPQVLEVELMLRPLVEQTDNLNPPSDFEKMHEHFSAYVDGNLHAILGIIDRSDERLAGSNVTFLDEFDKALDAWDDAVANRDRVCD